jgi:hypothetical protein
MISKWTVCGFLMVALGVSPVEAGRHYGIITDLTNSPRESASMDVITPQAVTNVGYLFKVYASGQPSLALPPIPVQQGNSFASSLSSTIPNLFTPSGGQAALVSVETVDFQSQNFLALPTAAVLRQRSGTSRILTSLPPEESSKGQYFVAPIGDLEAGTWLFVAAIDLDTAVWVTLNGGIPTTAQPIPIPAFTVVRIPMTTPNSRVDVTVAAKADGSINPLEHIMVMLAVDSGTKVEQTILNSQF